MCPVKLYSFTSQIFASNLPDIAMDGATPASNDTHVPIRRYMQKEAKRHVYYKLQASCCKPCLIGYSHIDSNKFILLLLAERSASPLFFTNYNTSTTSTSTPIQMEMV
eukprot:scaffold4024_cov208-Skeletonema_marinoi.AAC.7